MATLIYWDSQEYFIVDQIRIAVASNPSLMALVWRYMTRWETRDNGLSGAAMRVSDDNGEIFGPMMRLSANGTIDEVKEQKKENRLYFSLSFSQLKLHKKFLLVSEYDKFTEIAAYKTRLWMNIYFKVTLIMIKYSPRGYPKVDTRSSTKPRDSTSEHVWLDTLLSIIILE